MDISNNTEYEGVDRIEVSFEPHNHSLGIAQELDDDGDLLVKFENAEAEQHFREAFSHIKMGICSAEGAGKNTGFNGSSYAYKARNILEILVDTIDEDGI